MRRKLMSHYVKYTIGLSRPDIIFTALHMECRRGGRAAWNADAVYIA